jgi:hypothetical protein
MPASLGNKLVYSDGKLGTITPPYVVYGGLVIEIKRTSDNLFTAVSVPLSAVYKSAGTGTQNGVTNTNNGSTGSVNNGNTGGGVNNGNTGGGLNSNQNNNDIQNFETLEDPLGGNATIESLLLKLFEIIMYVGIPVVAFFIIWSGFMFVTAQGNAEKLETARQRLLWTIIGAILLLGAWTISQAIKGTVEDIRKGGQTTNSN